jgi:putative SOS response-associated peptidase YedK
MCNSTTTNQAAIINLFRVINRYVGNLPPMPGVFPDYPAPVVRNTDAGSQMVLMRWGMPPPPRTGGPPVTNIRTGAYSAKLTARCSPLMASGRRSAVIAARSRSRCRGRIRSMVS